MTRPQACSPANTSVPAVVYTASWRVALAEEPAVQPVRISVGCPRWITRKQAERYPLIRGAAPFGLLGRDLSPDQFRRRYLERLDRHADEIVRDLADLRSTADRPLLLCCFKLRPEDCHRSLLARWLEEQTGVAIPEFVPATVQLSLTEEDA